MPEKKRRWWTLLLQRAFALAAAGVLTLAIFLVLPLMQTIGGPPPRDLMVRPVDTARLPPPPPPPPEEPEDEEEPPPPPPDLSEEAPPLELAQLELALNPGIGDGLFGDFAVQLVSEIAEGRGEAMEEIFSLSDLDQRPRVIFQRKPTYPPDLRRKGRQGTVYVTFMVDTDGRVVNPQVEKSTDPAFERPALEAVRQWKFEPGTRKGTKVPFKLRIPITFNAA